MADSKLRFKGTLRWDGGQLDFTGRTLVMGILNVTPDSFSDGGRYLDANRAVVHGLQMAAEGADIIDVGGQSTRPGSEPVGSRTELERVLPVVAGLADKISVPISIDTTDAEVARGALDAGASIVNDISALRFDEKMAPLVAERGVPLVLMHMQGTPATMQTDPRYKNVISEIKAFLRERLRYASRAGIDPNLIMLDVGIGFGKQLEHNVALLGRIDEFFELERPILVGHSRKRLLGELLDLPLDERDSATLAASSYLASRGVHILRVHQVGPTRKAVELIHHFRSAAADNR